jgi:hypothetical protein
MGSHLCTLLVSDAKRWHLPEISARSGLFRMARVGIFPRSSLLGAGRWGSGNLGRVGQLGEGWGKRGQFTSNLRGRWTIPITTGGYQVSRREHKGDTKGCNGRIARGGKNNGNAPCIYVIVLYVQRND